MPMSPCQFYGQGPFLCAHGVSPHTYNASVQCFSRWLVSHIMCSTMTGQSVPYPQAKSQVAELGSDYQGKVMWQTHIYYLEMWIRNNLMIYFVGQNINGAFQFLDNKTDRKDHLQFLAHNARNRGLSLRTQKIYEPKQTEIFRFLSLTDFYDLNYI